MKKGKVRLCKKFNLKKQPIGSGFQQINVFISNSSRPLDERTLHVEGGLTVKISHANENLVSSIGWPDNLLKVVNLKSKVVVLCGKVKLIGGMTWHYKLPYVCAGSDRELCFWRINVN